MQIDEGKTALASALLAAAGIALLFLLSETPRPCSVAQAAVALPSTLVQVKGTAANVTPEKFLLCDRVCISVRGEGIPAASLLREGQPASVLGRVREYRGGKYIVAEKIGLG
jgi:DNA/RNA endonuclease YhcR with UshA esterase domain